MRHSKSTKKFGLKSNKRKALYKALAVALITKEKIQTTEAKAKALRPVVEKLITKAKLQTLASVREVESKIGRGVANKKLVSEIAPKFKDRKGGYTRIIKLPRRKGDASKMALIEFVN